MGCRVEDASPGVGVEANVAEFHEATDDEIISEARMLISRRLRPGAKRLSNPDMIEAFLRLFLGPLDYEVCGIGLAGLALALADVVGLIAGIKGSGSAWNSAVPVFRQGLTAFLITANELDCSRELDSSYHVYRVFEFSSNPRLFSTAASSEESSYVARRPNSATAPSRVSPSFLVMVTHSVLLVCLNISPPRLQLPSVSHVCRPPRFLCIRAVEVLRNTRGSVGDAASLMPADIDSYPKCPGSAIIWRGRGSRSQANE